MKRIKKGLHPNSPLKHRDHSRPTSRRDFIRQGFMSGAGVVTGGSLLNLIANPRMANAELSLDIQEMANDINLADNIPDCNLNRVGGATIPFICFDLAGGANFAGSNVLVGTNSQLDPLSTAGYSKLGVPGDRLPNAGANTDTSLGLAFHSDSALLAGILEKVGGAVGNINGAVIPARSENDTGNNPHNPMYTIANAGAEGSVVTLVGSRNSDSGGNSMSPGTFMNPEIRPTKVDRPTDVTGMIDTGNLTGILTAKDVVPVMETVSRISHAKLQKVSTGVGSEAAIKDLVSCNYMGAASVADRFATAQPNPATDPLIVGPGGIFTQPEFDGSDGMGNGGEFRKTASVMKMVLDEYAGAGTITMGGFDYHTGDRSTGEARDLRAGRCIGACLAYAAARSQPLMIYVCSDGSVASNGTLDDSPQTSPSNPGGQGKGVWTGDNSSTACSFFLVYSPNGQPAVIDDGNVTIEQRQQIGAFRADGSVDTSSSPAANNVNLLVNTLLLNYMVLNDGAAGIDKFQALFAAEGVQHGLGNSLNLDQWVVFDKLV